METQSSSDRVEAKVTEGQIYLQQDWANWRWKKKYDLVSKTPLVAHDTRVILNKKYFLSNKSQYWVYLEAEAKRNPFDSTDNKISIAI